MSRTGAGALLTVLLIGLLWGLNWPAIKYLLQEGVQPVTLRAVAFSVAALALLAITRVRRQRLLPPVREIPWTVLTGLLVIFGFNMLTTLGQIQTETSRAAIIAYTMPALTALFSVLLLGERLRTSVLLALAAGMAGISVLALENLADLVARPVGPLIMLGSAMAWALGTVALKAGSFSLGPLALNTWFLGASAALAWPLAFLFENPLGAPAPGWRVVAVWAWHALLPMVLCYVLWTGMVARLPATVAAIATLAAPVVGVVSAMVLLGDPVTWQKFAALGLILGSIALTFLRSGRFGISRRPRI